MQTLTFSVNVPDELVYRFRALPDVDRRAFLETMDAFAIATLAAPACVPAGDVDALRESLAEAERGQVLDGESVMREAFAFAHPQTV